MNLQNIKNINSSNISQITLEKALLRDEKIDSRIPTTEELIEKIRKDLDKKIKILQDKTREYKQQLSADKKHLPSPFEIALNKSIQKKNKLEEIITNIPKGFTLVPVLYSKPNKKDYSKLNTNFKKSKESFYKFLALNHADELQKLGICQYGIERMKLGIPPANEQKQLYKINIDHIIELSGCGIMASEQYFDPNKNTAEEPTQPVNHFSNFILLPEQIHKWKNDLNDLQDNQDQRYNTNEWVLMLIPENSPDSSGFVATPQEKTHPLHGLETYKKNENSATTSLKFQLSLFKKSYQKHLKSKFYEAAEKKELLEDFKLKTTDLKQALKQAFNIVSRLKAQNICNFIDFYNKKEFQKIKKQIDPITDIPEVTQLKKILAKGDKQFLKTNP